MIPSSFLKVRPHLLRSSIRQISGVIHLSDKSAVEKFTSMNEKSILYFTASWCPPCKMVSPIYEKLSKTHTDVAFGKVDVDANSESAMDYQISSVPTFVFFNKEKILNRFSGADQAQLESVIDDLKKL